MPIVLDTPSNPPRRDSSALVIGYLNNLGDAGMASGERQIGELLESSCGSLRVDLRLFSLPSLARGEEARQRMAGTYHDLDALLGSRLDGLFVTGAEPRATDLRDEGFWPELTRVIDWARTGTRSTIWSCLAAHAAVLHLDGIARRPLAAKCTGLFPVTTVGDHPLLDGIGLPPQVCHSRWNDLEENELRAAGYDVLTRGAIGVDSFARALGSQFVFLQGHPEYDAGALGRELQRDLARWRAEPACSPTLPTNYFTRHDEAALRAHISAGRTEATPPEPRPPATWPNDFAITLMRNWLAFLATGATTGSEHPASPARKQANARFTARACLSAR